MTSQINPNNIDGTYPVAGVPNNTQGMRDNFTNTRTNFQYAADEITELQSKALLKAAITGTTLDNNMNNQEIYAVQLRDLSYAYSQLTATAGTVNIDFSVGQFQQINPSAPVSLNFSNWPTAGTAGLLYLLINITNVSQTVTFPAAVNRGIEKIAGSLPGTAGVSNTVTFGATGYYAFQLLSTDGGANIWIFDDVRPPDTFTSNITIANTSVSTSTSTGALVVTGGTGMQGNLNVGGNLRTYTSGGNIAFQADVNGFVTINAPTVPANTTGALQVVGSAGGAYQPILNAGGMVHVTGNDGSASRITNDSFGAAANAYPLMVQRRGRGTAASPTAVQSGDILARYGGTGYGNVGYVLAAGNVATNTMDVVALENYTTANGGASFQFYTSQIGVVNRTLSANITANVTTFPANVAAANVVVSGTGGVFLVDGGTMGYGAGAGGTVSQTGNKSSGVTLNKPAGEITMQNTALGADATVQFTLTNSAIGARDVLLMNIVGGVATGAAYNLDANCSAGSAVVSVRNITGGSLSEAIVLRFVVIKGSIT
jgi:hypothetical protein